LMLLKLFLEVILLTREQTLGVMSHKSDHWPTPNDLYHQLNDEFNFDFDPCPLCSDVDFLSLPWGYMNFVNPPYSNIISFVSKAIHEYSLGKRSVFLVPARTDTAWFHTFLPFCSEVRFIKGRLKFGDSKSCAPFPSIIMVMR